MCLDAWKGPRKEGFQDMLLRTWSHVPQDLADACEAGDSEAFTDALGEYDNMTRLDA